MSRDIAPYRVFHFDFVCDFHNFPCMHYKSRYRQEEHLGLNYSVVPSLILESQSVFAIELPQSTFPDV